VELAYQVVFNQVIFHNDNAFMNLLKFNNNGSQSAAMMQQANEVAKQASDQGIDVTPHLQAIDQARNNKDTNGFMYAIQALNDHVKNEVSALNNQQQARTIASRLDAASKMKGTDPNQIAAGIDAAKRGDLAGASAIAAGIESQLGKSQLVQVESDVKAKAKKLEEDTKIGIEKDNYVHNAKIFYDKLQALTPDDVKRLNGAGYFITGGTHFVPTEETRDALRRYKAVEEGSKLLGISQDRAAGMGARISNSAMQAAAGNLVPFGPGMSVEGFRKARDQAAAIVQDIYHEGAYDKYRKENGLPPSGGVEDPNAAASGTPKAPSDPIAALNPKLKDIIARQLSPAAPPSAQPVAQSIPQSQQPQQVQQPQANQNDNTSNPAYAGSLNYYQPQPIQAQ